ncbi:hypothetical protein SAMN04487818_10717 [Actinokineospora terrae]|uniref:Uncharacterized protein n=1 Tax=Actinokineospora terrae TaxID=155974 RepID=A0A1H9U6T5_9PSEU|nr:hypothetical protein SAMN04487818_10717 [Actinokineospora terrae]
MMGGRSPLAAPEFRAKRVADAIPTPVFAALIARAGLRLPITGSTTRRETGHGELRFGPRPRPAARTAAFAGDGVVLPDQRGHAVVGLSRFAAPGAGGTYLAGAACVELLPDPITGLATGAVRTGLRAGQGQSVLVGGRSAVISRSRYADQHACRCGGDHRLRGGGLRLASGMSLSTERGGGMAGDQYSRLRIAASSSRGRTAGSTRTAVAAVRLSTRGSARCYLPLGSGGTERTPPAAGHVQCPVCRKGGQCPV